MQAPAAHRTEDEFFDALFRTVQRFGFVVEARGNNEWKIHRESDNIPLPNIPLQEVTFLTSKSARERYSAELWGDADLRITKTNRVSEKKNSATKAPASSGPTFEEFSLVMLGRGGEFCKI